MKISKGRKTHFKLSVQYLVPYDKLFEFVEAIKPYSKLVDNHLYSASSHSGFLSTKRRQKRLKWILNNLVSEKEQKIGYLFKSLTQKGYGHAYKTFQRDIMEMGILGLIEIRKTKGGTEGNTSLILLRTK